MAQSNEKLGVVIGGGNGIGESISRVMTNRGWRVVVIDLDAAAATKVAEDIGGIGLTADISDEQALCEVAQRIEKQEGPVEALVVSAAAFQEKHAPEAFPREVWRRIMDVNIEGCFNANQAFGMPMTQRGKGAIVNVASAVGHFSSPLLAYGASKAAVINLTKSLAGQWGRFGVRVNSVSPGATIVPRIAARPPGRYATDIGSQMALGRRVQPDEVAEGVEFLISERASAITGIDLLIDAGWLTASSWGVYGGVPDPTKSDGG